MGRVTSHAGRVIEAPGRGRGGYTYLVEQVGANATVYNNDGTVAYAATANHDAAINWALANLTAGRTEKETVKLLGEFEIDTPLLVYSYTIFDLTEATITLADDTDDNMIENEDQTAGNEFIDIVGGILRGNKANQAATSNGIDLQEVDCCTVDNVTVIDVLLRGINLAPSTIGGVRQVSTIKHCKVIGCDYAGIAVVGGLAPSYLVVVEGNYINDCVLYGIMIYAHMIIVADNQLYDFGSGIYVYAGSENILVNNTIGLGAQGMFLQDTDDNFISGNTITGCSHGILGSVARVQFITDNIIRDCTADNIKLDAESNDNKIYDNDLKSYVTYGTNYCIDIANVNCLRNWIRGNIVGNADIADIQDLGTDTVINNNAGNVEYYQEADYGAAWANWVVNIVGVARNGTRCIFWNTNTATGRLGCYANGAWRFIALT